MKSSAATILAGLAFLLSLVALVVAWQKGGSGAAEEKRYEVAPAMGDMQRFAEKLYFAGAAGNWPLADFYLHEIEETTAEIIKENVVDEGVPVGAFMRTMFPPSLEGVEGAIRARNAQQFAPAYEAMLSSCNACHQSTGHGFVKITTPRQMTYENQDYRP